MVLGFDTSNYTTSVAISDGVGGKNCSRLLDVRPGELGLRQSDALFAHVKRLPELARALFAEYPGAEITAITDDCDRSGWRGYMRCGMDAMKTSTRPLQPFETEKPLGAYKLVIVGSPVWAGRCASPIRALLKRRGLEMENVAYVVTRSTTQRSEEVYDQMDMYTGQAHRLAVSLRPDSEGYEFWRNDFIQNVRRLLENG